MPAMSDNPTFVYTITSILTIPNYEGVDDVVYEINWSCVGTKNGVSSSVFGSVSVEPGLYTQYATLTEESTWALVNAQINRTQIQQDLTASINVLSNPASATYTSAEFPWNQAPSSAD